MMMDTYTALPSGMIQKVLQNPLIRLIVGLPIIFLPVILGQSIIISLSTGWLRGLLAMAYTLPFACNAY